MAPPPPRRMRSAAVSLGLVGALAFTLSGCGTSPAQAVQRQCVDDFGQVVTEAQCLATPVANSSPRPVSGGGGYYSSPYRWYYGGSSSGGRVTGGSYDPPANYRPSGGSSGIASGGTTGGVDTGGFGGKSGSSDGSSSSSGGKSGGSSGGGSGSSSGGSSGGGGS